VLLFAAYQIWCYKRAHAPHLFNRKKVKLLGAALVVILSLSLLSKGSNNFKNRILSIAHQATTDYKFSNPRISYWVNSLYILKDNPLGGSGVGNWYVTYPSYHNKVLKDKLFNSKVKVSRLHNDFLEIFVTTGIVGGLLFLLFIFFAFRESFRSLKEAGLEQKQHLIFVFIAMGGVLIFANFSFPMR
jgi:O-antigen ligase